MTEGTLAILVVEDNVADAARIGKMLSASSGTRFSVHRVRYLWEALALIGSREFDVILCDLGLPDSRGAETALALRERCKAIPIVVLTTLEDEEAALELLHLDIQDYLGKGEISSGLLVRSLRHAIQRKRESEALRESELRYRTLFDSIDEGFCIVEVIFDADGKPVDYIFRETNPAFEKQTGLADVVGRSMRELAPGHEEHWFEIYGRVALTGEAVRFVNRGEKLQRWFDVYAFRYGKPEMRQVAILFNDITARRGAEEEVARLNAGLAARVSELQEANQSLEAFNRMVSHDLRQPLNLIGMACQQIELICGGKLDESCREGVRMAHKSVLRMNDLIEGLLTFSRSAHQEPARASVDLSALASSVADGMKRSDPGRSISFEIARGIRCRGDANLLLVVLENLIGNAWKYTANREHAVIEVGAAEIEGETAYFVRDNGRGFDPADAGELFIPFKRLPGAEAFRGFGIGLATVARIIQRHGGRVWAEGAAGKGATFYFTLAGEGAPAAETG